MTITALMDNYCRTAGLKAEHGLSLHIHTDKSDILFDAASTPAFLDNAAFLGTELGKLDAVVLSHGHYDHAGGLAALYASFSEAPPLFAGRGWERQRWAVAASSRRFIGVASPDSLPEPHLVEGLDEIAEGIFLLPAADRLDGSEPLARFRVGEAGQEVLDEFDDELALVLVTELGLAVITGCAHRGVVNIVRAALLAFPDLPLKAVIGGFHLADAPETELRRIASELADLGPERLYCNHCTGVRGYAALSAAMPNKVDWLSSGMSIEL